MPTVLDFAGADIPDSVQGSNLSPILRGECDALAANGAQRTMLALALACGWTDGERAPAELADTEHGGFVADYARRHLKRQREMDSEADSDGDGD